MTKHDKEVYRRTGRMTDRQLAIQFTIEEAFERFVTILALGLIIAIIAVIVIAFSDDGSGISENNNTEEALVVKDADETWDGIPKR